MHLNQMQVICQIDHSNSLPNSVPQVADDNWLCSTSYGFRTSVSAISAFRLDAILIDGCSLFAILPTDHLHRTTGLK